MTAEQRANQLIGLPAMQVPRLARAFANHLVKQHDYCTEIIHQAYVVFAQVVEGLTCEDPINQTRKEDAEWFQQQGGGE